MVREINLLDSLIETSPCEAEELEESLDNGFLNSAMMPDAATLKRIKRLIEALLFAYSEPLPFQKMREICQTIAPLRPKILRSLLLELQHEYIVQERAFRLEEIAQGYVLRTCEEFAPHLEELWRCRRGEKLTAAATEVLAIIAYKQPITRPRIDAIRGVDSSGIMQSLLERRLIEAVGKLEAPGRPTLYAVTKQFMAHFGLRDLSELPNMNNAQRQDE